MPIYIDGRVPVSVTTLMAGVVQTPYLQMQSGAMQLHVTNPANPDDLVVLSGVQTMSSKTLLRPVITGGTQTAPAITSGTFTSGTMNTSTINTPTIAMTGGGTLSGGIQHNVICGRRVLANVAAGASKTLDLSTADVFVIGLTQACTLTVSNATSGKFYQVITKQTSTNNFELSWMTGYISEEIASGPTRRSGSVDAFNILYDGNNHIGWGIKDIQG